MNGTMRFGAVGTWLAALGLLASIQAGSAQSIDELPHDVFAAARSLENECTRLGGSPDYEPLRLVTFVFFGNDWDNGGRESYIIDTAEFRCSGIDPDHTRPFCRQGDCRLIVMTPNGRSAFSKGFDREVSGWRLVGDNASSNGPNVLLQTTENGSNLLYRVAGAGMTRTGPAGG